MTNEELEKKAAVARDLNCHEAELLNHRMGWLVQTQGLLFAALAFSWDKESRLSILLAVLGIASSISLGLATSLVSKASKSIYEWWESLASEEERAKFLVVGLWGPSKSIKRLLRPWRALPIIFAVAWIGVIILRITK